MIIEILEGSIKFIFYVIYRLFIEGIFFYSGECLLYFITFGKKKPRWNYYFDEKPTKFVILTEFSIWIGLLVWIFIVFIFVKHIL